MIVFVSQYVSSDVMQLEIENGCYFQMILLSQEFVGSFLLYT